MTVTVNFLLLENYKYYGMRNNIVNELYRFL